MIKWQGPIEFIWYEESLEWPRIDPLDKQNASSLIGKVQVPGQLTKAVVKTTAQTQTGPDENLGGSGIGQNVGSWILCNHRIVPCHVRTNPQW